MMKVVMALMFFAFASVPCFAQVVQSVWVSQKATPCFACSDLALRGMAQKLGPGNHYIYDLHGQKLTYWHVGRSVSAIAPPDTSQHHFSWSVLQLKVERLEVPQSMAKWFSELMSLYRENGNSLVINIKLPYKNFGAAVARSTVKAGASSSKSAIACQFDDFTVWNVVDQGARQTCFLRAARQAIMKDGNVLHGRTKTLATDFADLFFRHVILDMPDAKLNVTMGLDKDSRITIAWHAPTREFRVIPGTAYDRFGNNMPDSYMDVTNGKYGQKRYAFPNTGPGELSYAKFRRRIGNWGIKVRNDPHAYEGVSIICAGTGEMDTCTAGKYR